MDACDVAASSDLLQDDDDDIDRQVCYFSKQINNHRRNYSTIEEKCLSLILTFQHCEVNLISSATGIVVFFVITTP